MFNNVLIKMTTKKMKMKLTNFKITLHLLSAVSPNFVEFINMYLDGCMSTLLYVHNVYYIV